MEEGQKVCAVVLDDGIEHDPGQALLFAELQALLDVIDDDQRTARRLEVVVGVSSLLVLDEVLRAQDLSDVVVQAPCIGKNGVGSDLGTPTLRQVTRTLTSLTSRS